MKTPKAERVRELSIKNIMANLKGREGSATANKRHDDALTKLLGHYLNGGS